MAQEFRVVLTITANTAEEVTAQDVMDTLQEEFTEWSGGTVFVESVSPA
jgi:hypothetical protein